MFKKQDYLTKSIGYLESNDKELGHAFNILKEKKIIEYDEKTNTLTVNLDMKIKVKGTLEVDVDEHVFISSGKGIDPDRDDGVKYSIWLNPSFDKDKNPIVMLDPEEECLI